MNLPIACPYCHEAEFTVFTDIADDVHWVEFECGFVVDENRRRWFMTQDQKVEHVDELFKYADAYMQTRDGQKVT